MKKWYLLFLLVIIDLSITAQSLSVESFRLLENDLTANTQGTMMRDQNGEVAALIRVVTTEKGFVFDGGMMGVVGTKQDVGEMLIYVPNGIQKITIKHDELGVLRDYYFPIPIEKARTYELKLVSGSVQTAVEQSPTSQFVVFKVEPNNAVVFIDDDEPRSLDGDGMLYVRLEYGNHTYRVLAPSFITESGALEVKTEKITKQISLKSAKATLTVNTAPDVEIWINDLQRGLGSWTGELEAGIYLVESRKPSHYPSKQEITLAQQEKRTLSLSEPTPIYGSLEVISTPLESNVYLDDNYIGQTPIAVNKILIGNHLLLIEKRGYQNKQVNIMIAEGKLDNQNIVLQRLQSEEDNKNEIVDADAVDLGLSVKWSSFNIGASKPEESGDYFAWGETNTYYEQSNVSVIKWKTEVENGYNWSSYKYSSKSKSNLLTKYCTGNKYGDNGFTDEKTVLGLEDDVAHIICGGKWRMPTIEEFKELQSNCQWTWTSINGVYGYKVVSKIPGYTNNSIFLPAVGHYSDKKLSSSGSVGSDGFYWSSSLSSKKPVEAQYFFINRSINSTGKIGRNNGLSVRPVSP